MRDGAWRHGWLYDCCADQEPRIAEKARHCVKTVPPQPDVPVAKMFFEAVLTVAKENDILIAPNARSAGASKALLPSLGTKAATYCGDVLNIIYKEYAGRSRCRLHEIVHVSATKTVGSLPPQPRLHYQLTTTASDTIVQADDMEMPDYVEQQEKAAIAGTENLLQAERIRVVRGRPFRANVDHVYKRRTLQTQSEAAASCSAQEP